MIPARPCDKNLSVLIDEELTLNDYITYIIYKSSYHYLRNICTVWSYLSTSSAKTIVHSVISAKLDYCNSLFVDIPDFFITNLQQVQNVTATIALKLKKHDFVTPYLMKLYWLPIRQCIIYNLNLIVFKTLNGNASVSIQSLQSINQLQRPLHSSDKMNKVKEH